MANTASVEVLDKSVIFNSDLTGAKSDEVLRTLNGLSFMGSLRGTSRIAPPDNAFCGVDMGVRVRVFGLKTIHTIR